MINKVKFTATTLGAIALIGVWQASTYNQAKQEKWNQSVPRVSQNVDQALQPVVENQTEQIPKPIDTPSYVIQEPQTPTVVPAINIQASDSSSNPAKDTEKKEHGDAHKHLEKEKERD